MQRQLSDLHPCWIAAKYHATKTMNAFVDCLQTYGISREEGLTIWKIIDNAIEQHGNN